MQVELVVANFVMHTVSDNRLLVPKSFLKMPKMGCPYRKFHPLGLNARIGR
jgi:hypothetical protein